MRDIANKIVLSLPRHLGRDLRHATPLVRLTIILSLSIISCEELEVANPADPNYELQAPTLISVEPATDVSMEISWEDNEEHTKEFVIQRKTGSGSYGIIGTVAKNVLTFTDTVCVLDVEYNYVVKSKVETNHSGISNTLKKATVFQEPSNLNMTVLSDESLRLNWSHICSFEEGYRVERNAGSGYVEIGSVGSDVTEYTDTGLTFGQSYEYRVAAYTSVNTSTWASITAATEFPAPTDLSASSVSDSEIALSWTDNTGYETGFKIERDAGSGYVEIGTVGTDETEYTDRGLTFGQDYEYRVAAYTSSNTSDYSATATGYACSNCVVDYDGNVYETITIGNQTWMAENLKVTHYRDGTAIPHLTDNGDWTSTSTGAYCYYDNNNSNGETYGALYNWYAVTDVHNIAPAGWHVPTDAEWKELEMYLGMSQSEADETGYRGTNEGSKLAGNADLWNSGPLENDSEFGISGFTALPGGYRYNSSGNYLHMGYAGFFWSATENYSNYAWGRVLNASRSAVELHHYNERYGFAIRLLRD